MAHQGEGLDEDRHLHHDVVRLPECPDTKAPSSKECSVCVDSKDSALAVLQRCKTLLLHLLDEPSIKWTELHKKDE